jgi:hypothetical protein
LIAVGFLAMLGSFLLLFPGLMLLVRYYVAAPVCVIEQIGPFAGMRRSAELTSGYRWPIFGLLMLYILITLVFGAAFGAVAFALGVPFGVPGGIGVTILIAQDILNAFVIAFGFVLAAVIYRDLRIAKEGIDTGRVAAVFD